MRDIVVTLVVIIGCLYTLKRPYLGVLLWSWLSYMNPHRLSWGFAYSMPFAQITAITLLFAMLVSKETKKIPIRGITVFWILFIFWMGITTIFAWFLDDALKEYIRIVKIQLITFVTMMLITDISRLRQLIWVIFISIGYFSVKGGVFTLLTGGGYRVWGPPNSFIEDNNGLAVAILMVIPLMIYLRQISENTWIKHALLFSIITSLFTVIGSQSRGALLAILSVGGFYWLKTKNKIVSGIFIAAISVIILSFMPESWYRRMETIETYEQDSSAMGRLNAWEYAFNAANDNLFGVGLNSWSYDTFLLYAPNPSDVHAAHSIYFSVLADHGWIGLFFFLGIFGWAWQTIKRLIKKTENDAIFYEHNKLLRMLQVSLLAYLSGGAFLSLSYFDLPWHLVSFIVLLSGWIDQKQVKNQSSIEFKKYTES